MLGVISTDEAMRRARDVGMDLVEISPNERPPVCKLMDFGKHKYLQSKKHKQKHHEQKLKEVRIRPKTDPHDREIKMEKARHFLEHGDKVQFTMMFKGRERFHQDIGNESFQEIITALADVGKVEQFPKMLGRRMTMLLVPTKIPSPTAKKPEDAHAKEKPKKPPAEARPAAASDAKVNPVPAPAAQQGGSASVSAS